MNASTTIGVDLAAQPRDTARCVLRWRDPLPSRALGAPVHTHRNEDEYSYVLEGRVGVLLGDEVLEAGAGELVFEIISTAGFENYFRELAPLLAAPERDEEAIGEVVGWYELDIDFATVRTLAERHGLEL